MIACPTCILEPVFAGGTGGGTDRTIAIHDVTKIGMVKGASITGVTVSCDTGGSSCCGVDTGDVSIGDMTDEVASGICDVHCCGSGSLSCCGGGANEDIVVGQFAACDQQSEGACTMGFSGVMGDGEEVFADGVALESGSDLLEVTLAVSSTGFFTGRVQCGEEHTSEDRDDGDYYQQYDRRNSFFLLLKHIPVY